MNIKSSQPAKLSQASIPRGAKVKTTEEQASPVTDEVSLGEGAWGFNYPTVVATSTIGAGVLGLTAGLTNGAVGAIAGGVSGALTGSVVLGGIGLVSDVGSLGQSNLAGSMAVGGLGLGLVAGAYLGGVSSGLLTGVTSAAAAGGAAYLLMGALDSIA